MAMNDPTKFQKFSSCRGVSFEIQPSTSSPFAIPHPSNNQTANPSGRWVWLPRSSQNISSTVSSFANFHRSMSRASSHFCDLSDEDNDENNSKEEEDREDDIEAQRNDEKLANPKKQEEELILVDAAPPPRSASVKKPKKPTPPQESRLSIILLDQGLFTVYKRLFAACFALNVTALALAATGHFDYAKKRAALFAIGNVLALTLCRSEALLRVVFWLAVKTLGPAWVPIAVKTAATAFLQSLGGVHSGCGVSSVAWLVYALILTLRHRNETSPEIIAAASSILALLCLSCAAAFPLIRHLHHNVFERTHRFAGWTALAILWAFVLLSTGYDPNTKSYDRLKASELAKQQEFWMTILITFFTIMPWVTVRRVPVTVTAPSGHASIIKFSGGVKAGLLGRISRSPLSEWHAFGIISGGDDDNHMMLAGAVGDFTKGLVSDPPQRLWVRRVHFAGLPYLVNMYRRVVLVATGSGICVFLSFLLQPCAAAVCVVWVTKGVEANFGREIAKMVTGAGGSGERKAVVHDTAVLGRPDVAAMAVEAAKDWAAEVVVVTSNPQGSSDVVRACKKAGIPAFGPIWDS